MLTTITARFIGNAASGEGIVAVAPHIDPPEGTRVIDARGLYLAPGFVDLHVREAARHGFSDITHLYSGCSTVRRERAFRVPGVVEAGLNLDEMTVQVIADGCHLPPALISLIYRCKGADGMYLITDGLEPSAMDMPEGTVYTQGNGVSTVYEEGVMKLMDRTAFAGSVATMSRLVRVARDAGLPLRDAVRAATETPARRIGLASKGRVAPGYDADLVLFDEAIEVRLCFARDRFVWRDEGLA